MLPASLLELADVERAADVLRGVANRTPVLMSRTLNDMVDGQVFLKCENFQRSGSFKFRGAYNKLLSMTDSERNRGVCAVSSGNHAQAVALAARIFGIRAVILMPEDAPAAKLDGTRAYGAEVISYDRYSIPQYEAGRKLQEQTGLAFVSSHDDPVISAGAGTTALELIEEVGDIEVLFAPIGGGGGIAGYATVVNALNPDALIVGAEPAASGIAKRSLIESRRVSIAVPKTIADGQQLTILGEFTFEVIKKRVSDVLEIPDDRIVDAMSMLFERLKIVVEPSGAIAVAALLAFGGLGGRRAGVIVTGGNVGADRFSALVGRRA